MKSKIMFVTFFLISFLVINSQPVNFLWAKKFGSNGPDGGHAIWVDALGNSYTTGGFNGTVDFDPGPGTFNLTSAGSRDIFICKLNAAGNFVWARAMGGAANNDDAFAIALDGSGNVYTTGFFNGTADF